MKMRTIALTIVLLAAPVVGSAQEWHGIVLLKSTCNDVKSALGVETCNPSRSTYELPGETVIITFSQEVCPADCTPGYILWNVPLGTVTDITRILDHPLPLTDFDVKDSKWKKTFTDYGNEVLYGNSEEGLMLTTIDGQVKIINYYPAAKNKCLRCAICPKSQPKINIKIEIMAQ
jgi:hypothetical protein